MGIHGEARFGSLVAASGILWGAHVATNHFTNFSNLLLPTGPLEVRAVGILIWLHAKWRSSVAAR